jgi:Mitochondrial carrier protein
MTLIGLFGYKFTDLSVKQLMANQTKKAGGRLMRFFCKNFPCVIASVISYPIFTVRNTMILQVGNPSHGFYFQNALMCIKKIFEKYGTKGFYGGFWLSLTFGIIYREVLFTREKIIKHSQIEDKTDDVVNAGSF